MDKEKEIDRIRNLIFEKFNNITFIEGPHKYYVDNNGNREEYTPVSHIIEKYNNEFDSDYIAEKYAEKHGNTKEYWLKEWKYTNLCATTSGTRTHLYGEGYTWKTCGLIDKIPNEVKPQYIDSENWLIPTSPKEVAIKKFYDELPKSIVPIGAEFQMSSQYMPQYKTKMCGTADLLFYYNNEENPEKSGVILGDWKTNSKLMSSYNREKNVHMLPPFDFMIDENLNHYHLQFGCYQLMLESIGIPIIGRRLIWLKENEYEIFKVKDVTNVIKTIL